jgi:pimeloyl-ACP methyl ester carboxylesterase
MWHIFALDLRGHGKSSHVPNQYRPEDYVMDVIAFIQDHFSEPVVLFGHSLGGWIALMTAARLTARVNALILGDPPLNMKKFVTVESSKKRISMWSFMRELAGSHLSLEEMASKLAKLPVSDTGSKKPINLKDLPGMDADYFTNWAQALITVDPDVVRYHAEGQIHEYVENVDLDAAMQKVICPVLIIQGDPSRGGIITDGDAAHALSLLAHGTLVHIEGVGHDLGLSTKRTEPLLEALVEFFEAL